MDLRRRDLLTLALGSLAVAALPRWASSAESPTGPSLPVPTIDFRRSLVLIELRGGNDGLNTVIPFADAAYARARPTIAIPPEQVLRLDRELGLHPAFAPLLPAWKERELGVVLGVGYPQPNRSHFRGIDIWNSGSAAGEQAIDGWLARLLHGVTTRAYADLLADAVIFGYGATVAHGGFGPLSGQALRTLVMDSPAEYIARAKGAAAPADAATAGSALDHVLGVQRDIASTVERLSAVEQEPARFTTEFPKTNLGRQLGMTAKLIAAEAGVPVWKLTIDGFDTHADQSKRHAELLGELVGALAAFRAALIEAKMWDRVAVMTYSEFGRRVDENASKGTDHGTAAPHLMLGGKVTGGWHGKQPDLKRLDDGDLVHTTDFRAIYRSIAQDWWGYRGEFLSDKAIKPLPGLFRT